MADQALPEQVLLSDPLSETVRAERRGLLLSSLLAIAVVKGHLMPVKLLFADIALTNDNQEFLLWLLFLVVGYFVAAFLLYAFSQFGLVGFSLGAARYAMALMRRRALIEAIRTPSEPPAPLVIEPAPPSPIAAMMASAKASWHGKWRERLALAAFVCRLLVDVALPTVVGIYALVLLWHATPIQSPLPSYPIWILQR